MIKNYVMLWYNYGLYNLCQDSENAAGSRIEYITVNPDPPRKGSPVKYRTGFYIGEPTTPHNPMSNQHLIILLFT